MCSIFCVRYRCGAEPQEDAPDVHALPDAGTGEGIPLQSLPDTTPARRDRSRPVPDGTADQDLVPESADESQKGDETAGSVRRASRVVQRRFVADRQTPADPVGRRRGGAHRLHIDHRLPS